MRFAAKVFGWLAVIGASACGSTTRDPAGSGGDGNVRGGASNGGSGGSAGLEGTGGNGAGGAAAPLVAPCFDPAAITKNCAEFSHIGTPLRAIEILRASSVESSARFRQLGGSAALIELGAVMTPRVAVINALAGPETPVVDVLDIDASGGDLEIVSVVGETLLLGSQVVRVFALSCRANVCQLFGAGPAETTLHRLVDFDLPAGARVGQLAVGNSRLCAYGAGLWCVESGRWLNVLAAEVTGDIAQIVFGGPSVAVTVDGRLFFERDGEWRQAPTRLSPPVTLQANSGLVSAIEADGSWLLMNSLTIPPATVECQQSPKPLLAIPGPSDSGLPWTVLLENGVVYQQRSSIAEWCELATGAEPETWIGTGTHQCHDATNLLALSETTLYSLLGPIECFVR